ncbi:MAG: 16S rRNA (uracil(1498)-N(3))-methyltransferase [Lentimicrobiaceae bacterium]|nr:16S rRNA (uracil(1498)-N(3))-methyltransferase [Lentimicrobiaceae bacterium]
MNVFYLPDAREGNVSFPEEESKHIVRVLRMREGDTFCVTNGKGSLFDAELIDAHPKRAMANLLNRRDGYDNRAFKLSIAIAPTKLNERTEWFLEKATEIGIDEIKLFASYHSERRVVNVERFKKIVVAAMKQSVKSNMPIIEEMQTFENLVRQDFHGQKFIAWIDEEVKDQLCNLYDKGSDVLVLIGPEGDFSKDEVELAKANGFVPVSLGEARLRTETAAIVACHTIQLINQMK